MKKRNHPSNYLKRRNKRANEYLEWIEDDKENEMNSDLKAKIKNSSCTPQKWSLRNKNIRVNGQSHGNNSL